MPRKPARTDAAHLRRQIALHADVYADLVAQLLVERGPLVRGSFGTRWRVCGRPNCRCADGELHPGRYLSTSTRGVVRQVHVPARDHEHVAASAARYRRFRETRRRIAELQSWQLEAIDDLCEALSAPYPAPESKARGRRKRSRT